MRPMNYSTFSMLIRTGDGGKFIEVVAVGYEAAIADIRAAYSNDIEIITWSAR